METTLNIRDDIFERVLPASRSTGISGSELIVILIKKVMADMSNAGHMGRLVQYQERRGKDQWQRFHIYLRAYDYEYFLDMRKLLKMSVSKILAHAVEKFLNKLLKKNIPITIGIETILWQEKLLMMLYAGSLSGDFHQI